MIFKYLKLLVALGDDDFNQIYPAPIRKLAREHWTPIEVAKKAADYLVPFPGARVLDIGSGAGKFCLVGAASTQGKFTGVEQRKNLVELSNTLAASCQVNNTRFLQANITEIPFSPYDTFYFFNSFYEHVSNGPKIDQSIEFSSEYYVRYSDYVTRELSSKPPGTRLVTYHTSLGEVPRDFQLQDSAFNGLLDFWEKVA